MQSSFTILTRNLYFDPRHLELPQSTDPTLLSTSSISSDCSSPHPETQPHRTLHSLQRFQSWLHLQFPDNSFLYNEHHIISRSIFLLPCYHNFTLLGVSTYNHLNLSTQRRIFKLSLRKHLRTLQQTKFLNSPHIKVFTPTRDSPRKVGNVFFLQKMRFTRQKRRFRISLA